jgi:AhpD family alkylhydroperoxidase
MQSRLDWTKSSPESYRAVAGLERALHESGLDRGLIHLLKLRASQINGCSYCVDMHTKEARKDGHTEQWIALVSAWRESPLYTAKERAVLEWTESVTLLSQTRVPDADFEGLKPHFSDKEIVSLTLAIATINVWNRLAVSFRNQHPIDT